MGGHRRNNGNDASGAVRMFSRNGIVKQPARNIDYEGENASLLQHCRDHGLKRILRDGVRQAQQGKSASCDGYYIGPEQYAASTGETAMMILGALNSLPPQRQPLLGNRASTKTRENCTRPQEVRRRFNSSRLWSYWQGEKCRNRASRSVADGIFP